MEIEAVRFRREAKHVEAVANGGTLAVASRLPLAHVEKGDRVVVHTPEQRDGEEDEEEKGCYSLNA